LRAILTAQLAGYEMNRMLDQPAVALGFSDQAIEDAHRASEVLPAYHRPHYIAATVHDHRGACYEILQRGDRFAPNEIILDAYRKRAATAYLTAEEEFRKAEALLGDQPSRLNDSGRPNGHDRAETREGVRIRRLKSALHGSNPRAALDEIERDGLRPVTPDQRYNAACLYCAAAAFSATLGGTRKDYVRLALTALAQALLDRPDYTPHALADPELTVGPAASCVANLIAAARSQDIAELAASDREGAAAALLETAYSDA
jgi:hypothetical protein